jgi:hypothetical protein
LNGAEQLPAPTIVGKTYVLEAGDPTTVSTDAGPVPDAEADEVRKNEKRFGRADRMDKLLEGRTFTKDETTELPADEIADVMSEGDDHTKVTRLALTFHNLDRGLAHFDMAMTVEQTNPAGTLTMTLDGPVTLDAERDELVEMSMTGTLTMTGSATAHGTMTISERRTR